MAKKYEYSQMFTFDGKRYNVRADSKTELAVKIALRKKELEDGRFILSPNTLVSAWVENWLETVKKPSVGATWYKSTKSIVDQNIVKHIGHMRLKDVRAIHCQQILNNCSGKSPSYCRKVQIILNEVFEYARRNKLILESPAEALNTPQTKEKGRRRPITPNERKHILKLAETHRAGLFIKLMLYCGLRPQEVAALQWCHIDIKGKKLSVVQALKGKEIGSPKSQAGRRTVPIPEVLLKDLNPPKDKFALVCTKKCGAMHTPNSIRHMWKSFARELNIQMGCKTFKGRLIPPYPVADDLVLYCLRHTYCTDLQAAGVPINVAKELMGHSSISITAEIYTHSSEESFGSAAGAINDLWKVRATPPATPIPKTVEK